MRVRIQTAFMRSTMKSVILSAGLLAALALGLNSLPARNFAAAAQSGPKLTAADGAAGAGFGNAVALSGDTLLIGAANAAGNNQPAQGAAYVFIRSGATWTLQQKLTAADGAANDNFGWAVALQGDTAVIGATGHDGTTNADQGAAYVFVRSGSTWTLQQKLTASDGAAGDVFGWAVAVNGQTALIGALSNNGAQRNQGAAYVFIRSGSTWTQQQKLQATDGAANDAFGASVALSGETALVGAIDKDNGSAALQGAAYVFIRSGSTWTQQQKLQAADSAAQDNFGASVALSGNTALIGAASAASNNKAAQGAAYVFLRAGTTWSQQAKLTASDGAALDNFGASVALNGEQALIGAPGCAGVQGAAYVFARSGSAWNQPARLTASDAAAGDAFGNAVALDNGRALAGALGDDTGANAEQGSAYVFDLCPVIGITPNSLNITTVGTPVSLNLAANGGTAPYSFTVSAGALPDGLTLATNGALTGSPTRAGSFSFTLRATATGGCFSEQSYTLTLTCNAITLSPTTLPAVAVSTAYPATNLTASGGAAPYSFTVSAGALPAGLSLSTAGALSGTPTQAGTFTFTVRAADANGCAGTQAYELAVTCPALSLAPATLTDGTVGAAFNQTLTASGGLAPYSFSLTAGSLPTGLMLATNGALSGTPTQAGSFPLTFKATDARGCVGTQSYTLTLTCPTITVSPATLPNSGAATVGQAFSQVFTANGGNGAMSFSLLGTLPTGLSFAAGTATLSGTPTQAGSFPLTLKATDVNGCVGMQNYTLTLTCPTVTLNPATLPSGTANATYSQALTASGGLAPYSFILATGTLPTGLTLASDGTLSGTPTQSGSFTFTARATDANGCAGTRDYTLTLACPTLTLSPATLPLAQLNRPLANITFSASGGVAPYSFTVSAGNLPPGLTLNAGVLSGTPTQAGTFSFTITATDAAGCTGALAYSLTVRRATKGDFDGDGKTDLAIWRGTNGQWQVLQSGNSQTQVIAWGRSTAPFFDVIVPGDYDGDGRTDQAIWRGADSIWYIRQSTDGQGLLQLWGTSNAPYNDVPVPGDYDGDGKTDWAVFRPLDGKWYVQRSSDSTYFIEAWGGVGDTPVPADYDGDGKTDLAIWRGAEGNWYIKRSTGGYEVMAWGAGFAPYNDVPVPADYDGDGKADLAIWRGADSIWYVRKSSDGEAVLQLWGSSNAPFNDIPTPGDYDGDGKADFAVWRPGNGTWYVRRSADGSALVQVHGQAGDTPVPAYGIR